MRSDPSVSLSGLARLGFVALASARAAVDELLELLPGLVWPIEGVAADPDGALHCLVQIARRDAATLRPLMSDPAISTTVWRLLGASLGLGQFFARHPQELVVLAQVPNVPPSEGEMRQALRDSVGTRDSVAIDGSASTVNALRVAYRRQLSLIAATDGSWSDPRAGIPLVWTALADLAGAALDAALAVARTRAHDRYSAEEVALTQLAIIGMGKTGARELNYISDVDVIFVSGTRHESVVSEARAVDIATFLAREVTRIICAPEIEPGLWEVDAALRPEGKQGALVRSLSSHTAYYDRWAKSWEFQALLKARPVAGDGELGAAYIAAVAPKVWSSATRQDFVGGVQRMRERVTEHVTPADADYQIKLGEGGLRDIEFTVQLLQLVHGVTDESLHTRGTLDALDALVAGGYIGRLDGAAFAEQYRTLRLLEHRVQLRRMTRTHLMPRDEGELRILARSTRLAESADGVWRVWQETRRDVREIHVRLFYRPLLSAVAALPESDRVLSTEQAHARLAAIGFKDPGGALRNIGVLTSGLSRKATIQRHLMPVMVRWFAEGVDPDYGLLAFRRISDRLGSTPWFLRMLRDSSGTARRLTRVLSTSRYAGELMEWIPESVAWLDSNDRLRPRGEEALDEEARAIQSRHMTLSDAMTAIRAMRRRELLRTAMGAVLGVLSIEEVAAGLTDITAATIQAGLRAVLRDVLEPGDESLDFAVVAMGRFGGAELGFGSDADVLFVYDPGDVEAERASNLAQKIVLTLREQLVDHRVPLELDAGLRPEGRQGPLVRTLDAYAQYYRRWSLSWEAQALLRARGVAGSRGLLDRFTALIDEVRYPKDVDPQGLREIKRIKARVEGERLPQGIDPRRNLKLGPGTLSDVEWLVQLLQVQHAFAYPNLRTTSTLGALSAAVDDGLLAPEPAALLAEGWRLSSRLRSANTVMTGRTTDILPNDRRELDGIAQILEYPPHSASELEDHYLGVTRRARRSFERLFYGE